MKALHYQTQKEQKNLEERLAQEEVGTNNAVAKPRSQGKTLVCLWLYSGAKVDYIDEDRAQESGANRALQQERCFWFPFPKRAMPPMIVKPFTMVVTISGVV